MLSFKWDSPNLFLFLLVWGVLELILKSFEVNGVLNFDGVFPSFTPFFSVWGVFKLILEFLKGGVIDDLSNVIGTMSMCMSLLFMLVPHLGLADLSMSVIGTMSIYMFPLSKLVLHPSSHSPKLMTTFVSVLELHSLFKTCSIGGEASAFNLD